MKTPKLRSFFTLDEIETILMQIDLYNRNGTPQSENQHLCFISKRIAGSQGKKVVECLNCNDCSTSRRMYKLTSKCMQR
jgi:hypothetical protein